MDRALSVLVHGASKSGKSSFSVTGPAPRVYCDVEAASRFLPINGVRWDPHTEAPPEPDGIWDTAVVATRTYSDIQKVYQWLASGKHPFKSLVIDSISELQQRYIESMAGRSQLTQQQWGDAFREVGGLVRDIRDLTMHPTHPLESVCVTAMTKVIDGQHRAFVQGQLQTVLPYIWDVQLYLWVDQEVDELSHEQREVRKVLSRRTSQYDAGERVNGRIPMVLELESRAPGVPGNDLDAIADMIFGPKPTT